MSWQKSLEDKSRQLNLCTRPHKLTPEEDEANHLQYNRIFRQCGYPFLDVSRGNTRLLRVSVMQYPHAAFGATCVNMKLFKWDHGRQNYLLHTNTSLNVAEFKALRDKLADLDTLIDDVLNVSLEANTGEGHTLLSHPTQCPTAMNLK